MQRVNAHYIYECGWKIHSIHHLPQVGISYGDALVPLLVARAGLEGMLRQQLFRLTLSQQKGAELYGEIDAYIIAINESFANGTYSTSQILPYQVITLKESLRDFETISGAELSLVDMYAVERRGAFNMTALAESGHECFPSDLFARVPESLSDAQAAARCIAFNLPTAAGFHLHRVNEAALRKYYDAATKGKPRPENRNIGDYLAALKMHKAGDPKVNAALKDLKDLDRNPLMHPDDALASADEAIGLLGAIRAVLVAMLKEIPPTPDVAAAIAGGGLIEPPPAIEQ